MSARHSQETASASGAVAGHTGRGRAADRKRSVLRTAVTATVTGLALTVPLGSTAFAALNPTVLKSLHLDAATLEKVQAYDRYRTRETSSASAPRRRCGSPASSSASRTGGARTGRAATTAPGS